MNVLKVNHISISFGGLRAVSSFNLQLNQGELVGLIGPNGAGKTTVFNMLTGVYQPNEGEIMIYPEPQNPASGKNIAGLKPFQVTRLGVARTFQNIRLFKELSVLDNVRIAFHFKVRYHPWQAIFRTDAYYKEETVIYQKALDLLDIFSIAAKSNELAKNLPYGEQRKLELVRALATNPQLLLLDEPAAGMNPQETRELMKLIEFIRRKFDLTILLIEHDMNLVMGICERLVVLDYGQVIAEGTPVEIENNPTVIKAYLGEEVATDA